MKDLHGIIIGNYTTKKLATRSAATKTPQEIINARIAATRGTDR